MDPYLGQLMLVAFNYAPVGWALCNGQLISIQSNNALFSLLGTTFGGDGRQTFGLPDLRGRAPIHNGQGAGLPPYVMGQVGGSPTVTIFASNLPAHSHAVAATATASSKSPAGNVPAYTDGGSSYGAPDGTSMSSAMVTGGGGGPAPLDNTSPYLVMNWVIATQGIYPPRG
jgi:microcystin-dependent protein